LIWPCVARHWPRLPALPAARTMYPIPTARYRSSVDRTGHEKGKTELNIDDLGCEVSNTPCTTKSGWLYPCPMALSLVPLYEMLPAGTAAGNFLNKPSVPFSAARPQRFLSSLSHLCPASIAAQ
jgi:hypothetical protein